jgi:hypothetical protein
LIFTAGKAASDVGDKSVTTQRQTGDKMATVVAAGIISGPAIYRQPLARKVARRFNLAKFLSRHIEVEQV